MGFFKDIFGGKKTFTKKELAEWKYSKKGLKEFSDLEKMHLVLVKGEICMAIFEGGLKMGNALKVKGVVKDDLRTKIIISAFAFGVLELLAQRFEVSEEDSRSCFAHYMAEKIEKNKEYKKVQAFLKKNIFKNKTISKIINQGFKATLDLSSNNLKNQILLHTILRDKKIKI